MGVDIRLYIGTLIAVLVFFGIGILVGIGITHEPASQRIEQQIRRLEERLVKELGRRDERIRRLELELNGTQKRMQHGEQLLQATLPMLVSRQLIYRNISIVVCAADWDGIIVDKLKETLKMAGANVPSVITFQPNVIQSADERVLLKLAQQLSLPPSDADTDLLKETIFKHIALLLRYSDSQGQWQVFTKARWVKISGDFKTPVGSVVFIGAFRKGRDEEQLQGVDIPLLRAIKGVGIRIVTCETTAVRDNPVVPMYQLDGVATVDHLDTPIGLFSVVAALTGQIDRYGFKATAKRPFPEL